MAWFNKKTKRRESVPPDERVVKTENVFVKCDACEAHLYKGELEDAFQVGSHCGYHFRIGARERLAMLFDEGNYEELDSEVISIDPLEFVDSKPYPERLTLAKGTSGLPEAIINGRGTVGDHSVVAGAMDMLFIGGAIGLGGGGENNPVVLGGIKKTKGLVVFFPSRGGPRAEGHAFLISIWRKSRAPRGRR